MDQFEVPLRKKNKLQDDNDSESEQEMFDDQILKDLLITMEQHIVLNQELRMKYSDQPDKFVDSEIDLDDDIRKLQNLSAYPQYLSIFYNSHQLPYIIQLLQHQNSDIVVEVLSLFNELVQGDNQTDPKIIISLYDNLIQNLFLENLFDLINRTQETTQEEISLVYKCLEIFEAMLDIKPNLSIEIGKRTKMITFLVKRIEDDNQIVDDNRIYSSELLVILLNDCVQNQLEVGRSGGIDNLLQVLAKYRKQNPKTAEEKEIIFNIFDSLTLILLNQECIDYFHNLDGLQLMIKLIQAKNELSQRAYSLLLLGIGDNVRNCKQLIDIGGLSVIFPILMKKGLKSPHKNIQQQIDESTVGLIKQLLRFNSESYKERIIEKCIEKIEYLIKLRDEYIEIVPLIDPAEYDQLEEAQLERVYFDLLGQGLLIVETCDVIFLELIEKGMEVKVDKQEILASVRQMVKYSPNEYYNKMLEKY